MTEQKMIERHGRCLCGAVHFKLVSEPLAARVCWCRDCQHLAANGTVNALVLAKDLSVSGDLAEHSTKADSGNEVIRQFCPSCGSHLFAKSAARPQFRVVRVGNFDDPSSIKPKANIWTSSAPTWACLNSELEHVEHQPVTPPAPQQIS